MCVVGVHIFLDDINLIALRYSVNKKISPTRITAVGAVIYSY